jgi:hypothetical protein
MRHQSLLHGFRARAPSRCVPRPRHAGSIEPIGDGRRRLACAQDVRHALRRIRRVQIVHDVAVGIDLAVLRDATVGREQGALRCRRVRIAREAAGHEVEVVGERTAVDALEPVIEQDELFGQPPLHGYRRALVKPHRRSAARALGDPLAHRHAVGAGTVLPLHVVEPVHWIVRLVEGANELQHRKRRVRQVGGEARIRLAVASQRRRQRRVRHAADIRLLAAIGRQTLGARVRAEEMIERAVLEKKHHDVIDRNALRLVLR